MAPEQEEPDPGPVDAVRGAGLRVLTTGGPDGVPWPAAWQPVLDAGTPDARVAAAMASWPGGFLRLVPEFARALDQQLVDVLPAVETDGTPVLAYVSRVWPGFGVQLGRPPGPADPAPPYFTACVPDDLRHFLDRVHAGLTSHDRSWGLFSPRWMDTVAELGGWPDGVPGWDAEIDSTRLLVVGAGPGSSSLYCCSPDLAPGSMAVHHEGDLEVLPASAALDELLLRALR